MKRGQGLTAYTPDCESCGTAAKVIEDHHNGCLICTNCGMQIGGQLISSGAEWRTFADDGTKKNMDPSRVGGVDDELFGIGTSVGGSGALANRHAQMSMNAEHRTLLSVMDNCRRIAKRLRLSERIVERAKKLCEKVVFAPLELRGKTLKQDSLAAVCVYVACRDAQQDRKKDEVLAVSEVNEKAFNKQYKRVATIRHELRDRTEQAPAGVLQIEALNYVQRYVELLGLPEDFVDAVKCIITTAKEAQDRIVTTTQSAPLAAAAIYFFARLRQVPLDLARVAGATTTSADTIQRTARELHAARHKVVPENAVDAVTLERMHRP